MPHMCLPCLKGGVSRRLTEGFICGIINIPTYSDIISVTLVIRYSEIRQFRCSVLSVLILYFNLPFYL